MPYSVWPSVATRATPSGTSAVAMPAAKAFVLAGQVPTISTSAAFSTSFPLTENPISQGGIWVNGAAVGLDWKNIKTNGSGAFAATLTGQGGHYDDAIAHLSTDFNANQYAQAVVSRANGYSTGHEIEVLVRFNISAHSATGYEVYWSTNDGLVIVRWNGPLDNFTPLVSTPVVANDGDVLRVEASGSTITAYVNGVQKLQTTDSSWSSGHPGIGNNPYDAAAVLTSFGWKSFTAGNL